MNLAGANGEIDAAQDLVAVGGRVKIADFKHVSDE